MHATCTALQNQTMVNLNYPQEKENDETTTPDQMNVENSNQTNIKVCKVDTVKVLVYALSCALIYPSVE